MQAAFKWHKTEALARFLRMIDVLDPRCEDRFVGLGRRVCHRLIHGIEEGRLFRSIHQLQIGEQLMAKHMRRSLVPQVSLCIINKLEQN